MEIIILKRKYYISGSKSSRQEKMETSNYKTINIYRKSHTKLK